MRTITLLAVSVLLGGCAASGARDEKCVEMPKGSFVYFAVASTDKEAAEELRNRISTQL